MKVDRSDEVGEVCVQGQSSGMLKNAVVCADGLGVQFYDGHPAHEKLLLQPLAARALAALLVTGAAEVERIDAVEREEGGAA